MEHENCTCDIRSNKDEVMSVDYQWIDWVMYRQRAVIRLNRCILAALICSLLGNAWLWSGKNRQLIAAFSKDKSLAVFEGRPLISRKDGFWSPEYDPATANETELDTLWRTAASGHGVLALESQWASAHGLSPSVAWPLDPSKQVYTFTVYHAIHCLRSLRLRFKKLVDGESLRDTWGSHGLHCFEVIRQELMCSATDTIAGRRWKPDGTLSRLGEGEVRQCADWEYLRDWATHHTAGYVDDKDYGIQPAFTNGASMSDGWLIAPANS